MPKSISATRPSKPAKPHKDFPLTPHPTGRWCKKVRGKVLFFGKWGDPQGALKRWLAEKDDLLAGRVPRIVGDGFTVKDLANRFLTAKTAQRDSGELAPRTFTDYYGTCERIIGAFGGGRPADNLDSADFEKLRAEMGKKLGPVAVGNEVQRVRCVFRYAFESGLIPAPIRFGPMFKRPSRKTIRKLRSSGGPRMFEAEEIRRIVDAADQPLKTMVLLGINCGFGNSDCGNLPTRAVGLPGGWVVYPRPKTGVERRCPLWPETVEAIKEWLAVRPAVKDEAHADRLFVTKYGHPWAKETSDSPIAKEFAKLLKGLGLQRDGRGFYSLRHTTQTVGDEARDPVAVSHIMGHVDSSMAGHYRERIGDERLRAVTDHIRGWLFPTVVKGKAKAK